MSVVPPATAERPRARPSPPEAPGLPGIGELGAADRVPVPGSIPAQLADPNTPPEVRAAASVSAGWSTVARRLRYGQDPGPEWGAVEEEANQLAAKIKVFRADPASATWADLVAEQRALIPRIRAVDPDEAMIRALDAIEGQLAGTP